VAPPAARAGTRIRGRGRADRAGKCSPGDLRADRWLERIVSQSSSISSRRERRWYLLFGLLPLALAAPARAQPDPSSCPAGNLLAGKQPWAWQDIRGSLALATDGEVAPEGAQWNAPLAVELTTAAATLTWDLGAALPLAAAWIQADANDAYTVWGSLDGRAFRDLGRIDPVEGHGLRGRKLALGGATVRFLRFGEGIGDGFYSLSELQLFCALPTPFPPPLKVTAAPPAAVARTLYSYWNDQTSARWELLLAALGFALLQWGWRLRREGRPEAHARLRDRLLAALGIVAALSYVNLGFFHFGAFIHDHEWTHYYLGAKYTKELSYDRLYECLSTADAEDGLRRRVELRKIMNLRTNVLERTDDVLAHPERCKRHFTAARWQDFKRDAAFFRARQSPRRWDDVQIDHGYNATPVWTAAGTALANLGPASDAQLYTLALLDPAYLIALIALVGWAFGWRVLAVALLVFATNFPSRFYWTGGSFLRWDWLFHTVAAICLLKKGRPALAGAALAYATLLRVFPLFVFVGPALALGWHLQRHGRLDRPLVRFFAAAAATGAVLVLLSLPLTGGVPAYRAFVQNTFKHQGTPMTNDMGLRTVIAWRPGEVGRLLRNDGVDPWGTWKQARLDRFREARPLFLLLSVGALVLLARATRRAESWVAAALALTLIAVGVELTSYYYAFIIGLALLHERREEVGRWLLLLTAFTQVVAWAPLRGMSTWYDEQYTAMAAASLVIFTALLWRFGSRATPLVGTGITRRAESDEAHP
jgi:hypothetical protein